MQHFFTFVDSHSIGGTHATRCSQQLITLFLTTGHNYRIHRHYHETYCISVQFYSPIRSSPIYFCACRLSSTNPSIFRVSVFRLVRDIPRSSLVTPPGLLYRTNVEGFLPVTGRDRLVAWLEWWVARNRKGGSYRCMPGMRSSS